MKEIVLATRNKGKIKEILQILGALPVRFVPLADVGGAPDVVEDGKTFRENAAKKAAAIAKHTGAWAMGEDSGIEVDALDGRPGIHSARYAGGDEKNNRKLLRELKKVPDEKRTARYRCAVVVADPAGNEVASAEGTCEGRIGRKEVGESGFGYDPLFVVPDFGDRTMAELGLEIKNRISHRARALNQLKETLSSRLE
ncbi:MAG: XTP/dITP diphosphatase [Planctomycetota bacterium]|jgi:XTP/dITP diphosphohydrolase